MIGLMTLTKQGTSMFDEVAPYVVAPLSCLSVFYELCKACYSGYVSVLFCKELMDPLSHVWVLSNNFVLFGMNIQSHKWIRCQKNTSTRYWHTIELLHWKISQKDLPIHFVII